jgi:hypothetical protein
MLLKTNDRCRNLSPLTPSYPRRGKSQFPSSDEKGRGWWDFAALAFFAPWRETGLVMLKNDGTKRECL